jgi:hypothetical protein
MVNGSAPESVVSEEDPDLVKLARCPITRGLGSSRHIPSWEYQGNGRRVIKAQEWMEEGNLPKNWKKKIGEQVLQDLVDTEWAWYECPNCHEGV